jgi:hypothetical protein
LVVAETVQDTPEIAEKKSRGLGSYVLWAFVAAMVYVLSSGPAVRWGSDNWKARAQLKKIYAPLRWLSRKSPLFGNAFVRYLDLWDPAKASQNKTEN